LFDIEHNGFIATLSVDGDLIRGEVLDTHELLVIEGRSIQELRKDFAWKVEAYCLRCERRGISPFDTTGGKSTAQKHAEAAEQATSGLNLDDPVEWPHRHELFFSTKSSLMGEQVLLVAKLKTPKIPSNLRLPIDDVIDILRLRRRAPKLLDEWKTPEGTKNLIPWLRAHLRGGFERVSLADPRRRDIRREITHEFIKHARSLEGEGTKFLEKYGGFEGFPRFSRGLDSKLANEHFVVVTEAQKYLIWFIERLAMMKTWALADLDELIPEHGGRPRLFWKYDFVAAIAELWQILTQKKPSSKPDALFADLVDAAWRSGGDDMPAVEWSEAIRTWHRGKKGGKTPRSAR
jgi:predicted HicB family RNase H-like nuclease